MNENDRILRPRQVADYLGIGLSTLYEWEATLEGFPKRIKLGERASGWRLSVINAWVDSRQGGEAA